MRSGVQRQRPLRSPQCPQGHGRVAFLPWVPVTLKCLKPKEPAMEPRTLGEHVKRWRIERKISQKQAAQLLGVTSWTVFNWETGRTKPAIEAMPTIIRFLGHDPFTASVTVPERLLAKRRSMGWSMQKAA